jgi:hypothetical protein
LADQLQILCVSHGWKAYLSERKRGGGYAVGVIKQSETNIVTQVNNKPWRLIKASSLVWCVSVKNGTVFTRRKGKVCVLGNTHRLLICEPRTQLYLSTDTSIKENYTHNPAFGKAGYIHPDHRWYINTGSFLRTFGENVSSYSEMGEYDPIELGFPVVTVKDRQIVGARKVIV